MTQKQTSSTKAKKVATLKRKPIEIITEVKEVEEKQPSTEEFSLAQKKKILCVASEARPFIATGGLADVIGSMPKALAKDPA